MKSVLFITYDGLTDPLGGSQILPYIRGIAGHPREMHVVSFEKPQRFAAVGEQLAAELRSDGIEWTPLPFTLGGKFAKLKDLLRMYFAAIRLMAKHRFGIVHCRSYQAAQVGCFLKRWFGVKVLFDVRGLWVDERIDGGIWNLNRCVDRLAYWHYKRVETQLLECADHVVALTEVVVPELRRLAPKMSAKVSVIPCCADFDHFVISSQCSKHAVRHELGIPAYATLMCYLGSLGTWYCFEDMLDAFITAAAERSDVHFLFITRDWDAEHAEVFHRRGGSQFASRMHVISATREEVPRYIGASDVMLSFITPAYSKMSSSPTKLAEAFACGVPVLCSPGVGDVDTQLERLRAGSLLAPDRVKDVGEVIERIDEALSLGGPDLRSRAQPELDLPVASARYRRAYDLLELN